MSLIVNGLTKKYGKNTACDNVNFTLEEGQLTVLLGPNGAGKSTVIKSIIGLLRYGGSITVDGILNKTPEAKRLIGYIPEIPSLYPNLTVSEHLEFIARAYKLKNYKDYADQLLERLELSDKRKKFGDELSKGMQQKLSICIGLLPAPKILLLDEPMIGLDPHAIKELKNMLSEFKSTGRAVLVSTHMIDSVDMLWDRTIIMQKGSIRANIGREEISARGVSLEDVFFEVTEGLSRDSLSMADKNNNTYSRESL